MQRCVTIQETGALVCIRNIVLCCVCVCVCIIEIVSLWCDKSPGAGDVLSPVMWTAHKCCGSQEGQLCLGKLGKSIGGFHIKGIILFFGEVWDFHFANGQLGIRIKQN